MLLFSSARVTLDWRLYFKIAGDTYIFEDIILNAAVTNAGSPRSAFVRRDFQLLRSFTFRVRAAAQPADHKKRWSAPRKVAATAGSRIIAHPK